jgi:hypothetical protein
MRLRRHQGRWFPGAQWVDGSVTHELAAADMGILFRHLLGAVSTSGAGPYTHTFTPGALVESTMTVQIGRPNEAGTVDVYDYLGMHIVKATISGKVGEVAQITLDMYGQHEDRAQTLVTAVFDANWDPLVFTEATVSIGGAVYDCTEFSLTIDNALQTGRHSMRTTTPSRPKIAKESGFRTFSGSVKGEYFSKAAYERYVNGTEAAMIIALNGGATNQVTITGNCRFDGTTPNVTGPSMLMQELPFVLLSTTSDAAACTAVLINSDATP